MCLERPWSFNGLNALNDITFSKVGESFKCHATLETLLGLRNVLFNLFQRIQFAYLKGH